MAKNPTPQSWAATLLQRLGIHQTPGAIQALVGWERAEGGHWNNQARYNPLNTTQNEPGAGNTGSQGNIKVYRDWDQGLDATVTTLKNGRYNPILRALRAGDPGAVANAIGQTPWGTSGDLVRRTILGTHVSGAQPFDAGGSPSGTTTGGGTAPGSSSQPGATSPDLGGQGSDFAGLLSSLLAKPQTQAQAPMTLQAPSFAAAPPLPQGFRGLLATQAPAPSAQTGVSDALGLISALGGSSPTNGIPGASQTADGPQMAPAATGGTAAPVKGSGKLATFDGKQVAGWIAPALEYARQHGWKGTVSSGYRTDAEQTRIYDSGVRPAAVPKSEGGSGSNHEGAVFPLGAIDVTNAGQLSQILRNSPYRTKLQWAGSKDSVHFSHPRGGHY